MTYTIRVRDWEIKSLVENTPPNAPTVEFIYPGFDSVRARIDTRYVDNSNPANPQVVNASNNESFGTAQYYLKENGSPFDKSLQQGVPPYDIIKAQPEIFFGVAQGGFLR